MAHTMKVQMFGNFRMEFDGVPLIAEKMHKESQFNRLMQMMMHYSKTGISKEQLEEYVIGEGKIGFETLSNFVNQPAQRNFPFILETPNESEGYAKEIALLREAYK